MLRASMVVVLFLVFADGAFAQTAPEKGFKEVLRIREQAKAAFDREMAREKAGDCQKEDNTRAIADCLGKEIDTSTANYKAYTGAVRSMLGMMGADEKDQSFGPTGKPLTSKELLGEFDATEAAWQKYRESQCAAAYDLFKGGTIAPLESGFCELMLLRSHMREIDKIYYSPLHN